MCGTVGFGAGMVLKMSYVLVHRGGKWEAAVGCKGFAAVLDI